MGKAEELVRSSAVNVYLRLAYYHVLTAATERVGGEEGDIFDEGIGEDVPPDPSQEPLISWLRKQEILKGVSWKLRSAFGDLMGFKGKDAYIVSVTRNYNNLFEWMFQSNAFGTRVPRAKKTTITKTFPQDVAAVMNDWHGAPGAWEFLKGEPKEADTKSGMKGIGVPLKDALAILGIMGKIPANKAPSITLRTVKRRDLINVLDRIRGRVDVRVPYDVYVGINGREWALDLDTVEILKRIPR